jgi:RNA polymerase II subunit A-like phosphatase
MSSEGASCEQDQTSRVLHSAKKLNLVLDLDHTLLHATADLRAQEYSSHEDVKVILLPIMEGNPLFPSGSGGGNGNGNGNGNSGGMHHQQVLPHFVKLRPHVAEFLVDLMPLFEITIYTAGTRGYAEKIANVMARHVLDYQMKANTNTKLQQQLQRQEKKDKESNGTKGAEQDSIREKLCLDEGELQALRTAVSKTKERLIWYKNKKDRQDYVKRMNQKFQEEQQAKNASKKESLDENGEPKVKKRRVCFEVTTPPSQDVKSDESKANEIDEEKPIPKKVRKEEDLGEDPTELLEELKSQLKAAEQMEKQALLLRKKIFGSRIISRTDVADLGKDVKSIKRVFPCGGMMAAIVDDREDVWANAVDNSTGRQGEPPDNLLLVRPYHWEPFRNFADINNVSGEDLGALDEKSNNKDAMKVEKDEVQLLWTKDILKRLHNTYYDTNLSSSEREKLSAPDILKQMRQEVFTRPQVKVLLSGLVPLEKQDPSSTRGKRPHYIRYAEELGAQVVNNVTSDMTHVIAARDGTDKVIRSRRIPGCVIVRESWLMECYRSISRRDIEKHLLGPKPLPPSEQSTSVTKLLLSGSDGSEEDEDDDEEDEDFFADFEKKLQQKES